jgi:hypothetical protein
MIGISPDKFAPLSLRPSFDTRRPGVTSYKRPRNDRAAAGWGKPVFDHSISMLMELASARSSQNLRRPSSAAAGVDEPHDHRY